jgi:hypothetical protein
MQVTVAKQQEFHVPSGLDWIGTKHTHVLAWQEDATTIDYWTELFHPECASVVKREWQEGRLTIHTNYSHETHGVQIWEGMDALIAYSSRTTPNQKPKYLYVNQNFTDRWHRRRLVMELRKHRMLSEGMISWGGKNQPLRDYKFPGVWRQSEPPEQYIHTNDESDMPSPPTDIWSQTAFNLISEAHHNDPGHAFSEKTWQAVWQCRPFLINGAPGIHKQLQDLGYELMTDVDYAFDTEPDAAQRIAQLVEQVAQLRGYEKRVAKRNRSVVLHNLACLREQVKNDPPPDVVHLPNQSPGAHGIVTYINRVRQAVNAV